jgi:hypothetical protein
MENEGKLSQIWQRFSDKIQDQTWFQQLKAKWDELDSRAKTVIKYAGLVGSVVLGVGLVGTSLYSVAETKSEIDEKLALIQKIQSSQDELRRLREVTARFDGGDAAPWAGFLQEKAQTAGFDPSIVQIVSETPVGAKADAAKSKDAAKGAPAPANGPEEAIIEVGLKRINVRQLVKYVHEIENGGRTLKVRRLQIDTAPDESGYLDAKVSLSAFRLKP